MLWISIPVAAVLLIAGGWYIAFCHFGVGPAFPLLATVEDSPDEVTPVQETKSSLVGLVDTQEEADKIAEQYGITLISLEYGVAVYTTEEDPYEVIARGKENDYPELSVNFTRKLLKETEQQ